MPEERLLRLEEVAQRLSISYTQVRVLVLYEDKIPHFKVGARGIRVKEEDLQAYIVKQQQIQEETPSGKDTPAREPYKGRQILGKEEVK